MVATGNFHFVWAAGGPLIDHGPLLVPALFDAGHFPFHSLQSVQLPTCAPATAADYGRVS